MILQRFAEDAEKNKANPQKLPTIRQCRTNKESYQLDFDVLGTTPQ